MSESADRLAPAIIQYRIGEGPLVSDATSSEVVLDQIIARLQETGQAVMHFVAPEAAAERFESAGIPFAGDMQK